MTQIQFPTKQNIDEVLEFMEECDIVEFGEPDSSREDLEEQWDKIDLSRDAWIARNEHGKLVGYADIEHEGERFSIDLYIHKGLSPDGLEDLLMQHCENRSLELTADLEKETAPFMVGYCTGRNPRVQQVYEKNGFERINYHYNMRIDLNGPVTPPKWPDQYRLEPYRIEYEMELYKLVESAFTWPGHEMPAIDYWRSLLFRSGRYDPKLFVMVRDGGRLIGAALSYDEGDHGWIRQLAIHKDYQGKGLGSLLLRHMFSVFNQRKIPRVALGVSSMNEKACQFYERSGMYRSREFIEFRKNISRSSVG